MNRKTIKIVAAISGVLLLGYVGFRIYKYQQLKSGNKTKDERKINDFYIRSSRSLRETGLRPQDYDDEHAFSKQFYRSAKFFVQRFGDLGIATSPQVNRLLFKNQEYKVTPLPNPC
jgi:hypothetical protein